MKEGFDSPRDRHEVLRIHALSYHKKKYYTYVGYTSNLNKRINDHNTSRGAKYTKGRYWKIIYKKKYNSKSLAMRSEYILKKNKKKRYEIKDKYIN